MKNDLILIKATYLFGIIADGLWAAALFVPRVYCLITNETDFSPSFETRCIMGIGGALMMGWTLLLIWALLKPIERKDVLILTMPVVLCLFIISLISVLNGKTFVMWLVMKTLLIMVLLSISYYKANKIVKKKIIKNENPIISAYKSE